METNSFFDINRLKYLIIRQLNINYKTMLIASGAIAGFLMFIGTVILGFNNRELDERAILGMVLPTLIIVGLISTSVVFSELNSPHRGYLYLTLPASAFEKLISSWLVTSIFYVIFGMIMLFILNLYYILIAEVFGSYSPPLINIFSGEVLKPFGIYMVVQSIFLLGAIYFRRVNFLKTILAWFVFIMLISVYTGLLGKILFNHFAVDSHDLNRSFELKFTIENQIIPITKYLFWIAVAPFFLTVSYFRLKERQV
jgi:hypothetical protein